MDSGAKKSVTVAEFECENYGSCCSNKTSETSNSFRTYVTQCGVDSSTRSTFESSEKIREDMIMALAWASYRTFIYQPSDPIHYLAHQLLRWRYGDVSEYAPRLTKYQDEKS